MINELIQESHIVFGVIWLVMCIECKDKETMNTRLIISNVWIAASLL